MNVLVPNYYHKFKCIADKCRHNCCIGWEIDIDDDTLDYYKNLPGRFGDKVRKNIDFDSECPHFVLKKGDRCPFLQRSGLCEIINNLGEDALCDICTDHPRFRNFFSHHTELGLGLCCEEAARVALTSDEPFALVPIDGEFDLRMSDEEREMFEERDGLFSLICDRSVSVLERMERISSKYSFGLSELFPERQKSLFLSLERLDKRWTFLLGNMGVFNYKINILRDEVCSAAFEQLLCYFVFRHYADGMDDGRYLSRIKFALASCLLVARLCDRNTRRNGMTDIDLICEYSRMLSSEIEYSQENLDRVFIEL